MTIQDQATWPEADLGEFTAAWRGWHANHEARLADPHGFLAVTSLHWTSSARAMPPPENRLPVAIEAGEKIPDERG